MPVVPCPHCSNPVTLPPTWSGAAYTCPHCRRVAGGSPPPAPPPRPAPPPQPVPIPVPVQLPPPPPPAFNTEDDYTPSPRRYQSGGGSAADFFSFRLMITPIIIQIVFWVGTAGCVLSGGYMMLSSFSSGSAAEKVSSSSKYDDEAAPATGKAATKKAEPKSSGSRLDFASFFMGLVTITIGPLMVRLYCELMIIIFKIHDELKAANDRRGRG